MSTVHEIEQAVSQLSGEELARFREWFEQFDAMTWDVRFEVDVESGRLDDIAQQAIRDFRAGKFREL